MITLYGSHDGFGLPQSSPFVSKAEILIKMADVPYKRVEGSFTKAPKGKIPYINVGGGLLGDSTFIRAFLEDQYDTDFDAGLSAADKAIAHAFQILVEDRLYWAIVHARWMDDDNFSRGPVHFFGSVPRPVRAAVAAMVRGKVRRALKGHGLGRHSKSEIEQLAAHDLDAISDFLAEKPFLMGDTPTAVDAAVWSMVAAAYCPIFTTPIRDYADGLANLVAYRNRGLRLWFPDFDYQDTRP